MEWDIFVYSGATCPWTISVNNFQFALISQSKESKKIYYSSLVKKSHNQKEVSYGLFLYCYDLENLTLCTKPT